VEQLYPYNSTKIKGIMASYSNAKKVVWVQEEPKNMGAWMFLSSRLTEDLSSGQKLYYSGRPDSASPAVGSAKISAQQQKDLVAGSFS
jgi:2-oxoglutarate dehydrogenase E1 component